MELLEALKRLEAAGFAANRSSFALKEAVRVVADKLACSVPLDFRGDFRGPDEWEGPVLPRGYGVSSSECLFYLEGSHDPYSQESEGALNRSPLYIPRAAARRFALHVRQGLLDEVAVWLERKADFDRAACEALLVKGGSDASAE